MVAFVYLFTNWSQHIDDSFMEVNIQVPWKPWGYTLPWSSSSLYIWNSAPSSKFKRNWKMRVQYHFKFFTNLWGPWMVSVWPFCCWTVGGSKFLLLMEEILHQVISSLSNFLLTRFYTSQVVQDVLHQRYHSEISKPSYGRFQTPFVGWMMTSSTWIWCWRLGDNNFPELS